MYQSSPSQKLQFDKEAEWKRKLLYDEHLSTRGNGTAIWPGVSKFTDDELELIGKINYYVRSPEKVKKVKCEYPIYQRIFCMSPGWDMYMHRDDRQSLKAISKRFYKEEQERDVPLLTSSWYGKSFIRNYENMIREHSRVMQIPEFYRVNGVGLAPIRKA